MSQDMDQKLRSIFTPEPETVSSKPQDQMGFTDNVEVLKVHPRTSPFSSRIMANRMMNLKNSTPPKVPRTEVPPEVLHAEEPPEAPPPEEPPEVRRERREKQRQATEAFNAARFIVNQEYSFGLNDFQTKLNNNILITGSAGTGKTTQLLEPNIETAVGTYFICEPKGQEGKRYRKHLAKKGYKVRQIDFTHPEKSDGYNPMCYIRNTNDIVRMSRTLTNPEESYGTKADPFWDHMTTLLLSAIIGYILEVNRLTPAERLKVTTSEAPLNMDFYTILCLVREGERTDDCDKTSDLKSRFTSLRSIRPDSWACECFASVDTAPNRTYDSIRSTLVAKFTTFDSVELRQMMARESFDFKQSVQEKTVVFVTVSDNDRTMDALVNLFFSQAINVLCDYADNECEGGRLPIPVRFFLDDFATNCRIDEFPRIISSIRSRAISVVLMIQAESQLWKGYDEDAKTIIANCDTYLYLGGNDVQTAASIAERCDCPLNEILYMPIGRCWVFRRGSQPICTELHLRSYGNELTI